VLIFSTLLYSIIGSVFFFVRLLVVRFGRAVGQTHSLPSLGLSVGWCGLAMCVAVKGWLYFYSVHFKNRLLMTAHFSLTNSLLFRNWVLE